MNNKLLFSSFMIIAMLTASANFSFADGNNTLSSDEMTFSIPSMTTVELDSSSVLDSNATATSETSLTLSSPLTAIFNISTLESYGIWVVINSTSPVDTNSSVRSYSYFDRIVLTKSDGSSTSEAVSNILEYNPAVVNNPNAIAFPISCRQEIGKTGGDQSKTGIAVGPHPIYGTSAPDYGASGKAFKISGEDTIACTISSDSIANTFGMNDGSGNYTATLTLTQVVGEYDSGE